MMAPALNESAQAANGRVRTTLRAPSSDSFPHSPTLSAASDATSMASLHQPDARVRTSLPAFSFLSERTLVMKFSPLHRPWNVPVIGPFVSLLAALRPRQTIRRFGPTLWFRGLRKICAITL